MNKYVKSFVAFLLAAVIMICPLSVCFAADPEPTPIPIEVGQEMWRESAISLIWALLSSWGIDITRNDVDEYTDEVGLAMSDLIMEYLNSLPSPMSIIAWTQMWTWGSDFWGNYRYNSSMAEDIEDFANWLIDKFNLGNNQNVPVDPIITINGYTVYNTGTYYECVSAPGLTPSAAYMAIEVEPYSDNDINILPYYFVWHDTYNDDYHIAFLTDTVPSTIPQYSLKALDYLGDEQVKNTGGPGTSSWKSAINFKYKNWITASLIPAGGVYIDALSYSDLQSILSQSSTQYDGSIYIKTNTVVLPTDDPSYTPGDGVTVVDNKPVYGPVQVVNPIQVGNLPSVISTGTIPNPGFGEVFLPIRSFVNTFSDGMTVIKDVIFHLPAEALAIFYAIMSITVIFGALHMFKEH